MDELFVESKERHIKNSRTTLRSNDDIACAINKMVTPKGIYGVKTLAVVVQHTQKPVAKQLPQNTNETLKIPITPRFCFFKTLFTTFSTPL